MKLQRRTQGGFTLIEIMVVVVILGLLATFAMTNVIGEPDKARVVKARSDLQSIESALERYKLDNFVYPSTEQGLKALVEKPTIGPEPRSFPPGGYLKKTPQDPWGREYQYLDSQDTGGRPQVYTLGADGQPGGEGYAADISNLDVQ